METKNKHIISVRVENRSGVLARVSGLFSARGYNIDSLTVSTTEDSEVSVMTIVVCGDDRIIEQVKKQLNKLIDVIKVSDHTEASAIKRELALIKVHATSTKRSELLHIGELFRCDIADVAPKSITFGIKGDPEKIDDFIELVKPYGIKELMRTGLISVLKEQ
jgi:acetolactate synthase I/III small subunit